MSDYQRFDGGHQFIWTPAGTYHKSQSVTAGESLLLTISSISNEPWVRLDYASVYVENTSVTGAAGVALLWGDISDVYVPLIVAAVAPNVGAGASDNTPIYACTQLSRPLMFPNSGHFHLKGQSSFAGSATIGATVSLSVSAGFR